MRSFFLTAIYAAVTTIASAAGTNKQAIFYLLYPKYLIHIYDCKNKIDIDYDGRGHDLSVRLNKISKDEFINKEDERNKFMLNNGLKIIRFVSMDDKIDLNIVKMIYNHAKIELLVKNKSIYIYNFNNKEIIVK